MPQNSSDHKTILAWLGASLAWLWNRLSGRLGKAEAKLEQLDRDSYEQYQAHQRLKSVVDKLWRQTHRGEAAPISDIEFHRPDYHRDTD